jgi:hypothetical protein
MGGVVRGFLPHGDLDLVVPRDLEIADEPGAKALDDECRGVVIRNLRGFSELEGSRFRLCPASAAIQHPGKVQAKRMLAGGSRKLPRGEHYHVPVRAMCLSGVAGRDNDRAKTRGDVPESRPFGTDFGRTNDRNNKAG